MVPGEAPGPNGVGSIVVHGRPHASAAGRNAAPILEVLERELSDCTDVLEIGSGTGQHAVNFAARLNHTVWQTSDLRENLDGIRQWIADTGVGNVLDPIELDVLKSDSPMSGFDAVFSSNTTHIMSYEAVTRMFGLVGRTLRPEGVFVLYGPFRVHGRCTTDSNAAFDAALRSRNPLMGLRDLDDLGTLGELAGIALARVYAMPANNLLTCWKKSGQGS